MTPDCDTSHPHTSVTLLAVGLLIFTLFQLTQVIQDGSNLSQARAQIEKNRADVNKALDEGTKMVEQLNTVAIGTQKLAEGGNANAKEIVSQMNKLGIKIDANYKKPVPGAPASPGAAPEKNAPPAPAKP